ncbi:hypothetical protein M422DRAFT_244036 [Sphaerobolus stellatus SS14]|nr:hypothetical protein M422DRAFT_244036 [Sphaerobolus stellatus SS14]
MSYRQPISDEQLAPFLEAAKLMTIPTNEVPPLALIVEAIDMNAKNAKEYEEWKELWYHETVIAAYLDAKRKVEEVEAKQRAEVEAARRKAEEAAAKKAAEEENERVMDANSEGEDEVDQDKTLKSKLKSKKTKSRPIVDSESEEETEEVKAERRKAKGKGKAIDSDYKRNTIPVDYSGCPGVPVCKICEGCKVPPGAWYQRPCMGDVQMDANDQIFYVRLKERCFFCLMRSNICSFTREDEAEFIMPEAANDKELQAKLKKLCDEQDTFKQQKDKEKAERSKNVGNRTKAGTKKTVQVNTKALGSNAKASGSTLKVVSEEDNITVEAQLKRARTVANSTGSNERIPSVAESLHAADEHMARYLRGIETCMANLQYTMQAHVRQVHNCLGELERRAGVWLMEDKEHVDEEVEHAEPEDMEEEIEEVREEVEEVREEVEEVREEVEEVREEVEEVKGGCEVEDDETMKDPEADEL